MTETMKNWNSKKNLQKLIDKLKVSPLPWRIEQNADNTWFIYDKMFRTVADRISNEGDAVFIVNLVNSLEE